MPLEQCPCIAVPTEPGPSGDFVSGSRASSDPHSPASSQLHPREEAGWGNEDPGTSQKRWSKDGLSLPRVRDRWHPGLSATHRPSLQLPSPVSDPPCKQRWLPTATRRLTPRSGFPNQTATGNFNEIEKGNCSYHCPTHVPSSLPHPLPPRKGSEAAPIQTPFPEPFTAVTLPVDVRSGEAQPRRGRWCDIPVLGTCRRSCSGSRLPCEASELLWICGCR